MKDGYYLSVYVEINNIENLYEFSQRHDQNLALWEKNGENITLVHYWELERVSGIKKHRIAFYDSKQAKDVMNDLLGAYQLSLDEIVEIWGTPQLETPGYHYSMKDIKDYTYHSICHLYSAILLRSDLYYNDNILGFAVDLSSDELIETDITGKNEFVGCVVREGNIQYFPTCSPGPLWAAASLIFRKPEGSLMALATASNSGLYHTEEEALMFKSNDRKRAVDYINYLYEKANNLTQEDAGSLFNFFDPRFSTEENKQSMVMKIVQRMSIRIMESNIENAVRQFDISTEEFNLAIAGGYALNCPTNSHLMTKYRFKNFIAPPCVNDGGISLGMGLFEFNKKLGVIKTCIDHPFYGDQDDSLDDIIQKGEFAAFIDSVEDLSLDTIVDDLIENPIVWFDGAAEMGPRALGHRSILGNPKKEETKDKLNIIKQREWWRPVAPIILASEINRWFHNAYESNLMLHTFLIQQENQALVPAILHLDGSARVQTIYSNPQQELLYQVIRRFYKKTGVPMICNTSLNDKGEPIINKIGEVLNFALRKNIDIAYINGKRVKLTNHHNYLCDKPRERPVCIRKADEEKQILIRELNPHNLSQESLLYYSFHINKNAEYDLKNKKDARILYLETRKFMQNENLDDILLNLIK